MGQEVSSDEHIAPSDDSASGRRRELLLFLALAVLIWPFVAIGTVAGWGFLVWIYHIFAGPPGPV